MTGRQYRRGAARAAVRAARRSVRPRRAATPGAARPRARPACAGAARRGRGRGRTAVEDADRLGGDVVVDHHVVVVGGHAARGAEVALAARRGLVDRAEDRAEHRAPDEAVEDQPPGRDVVGGDRPQEQPEQDAHDRALARAAQARRSRRSRGPGPAPRSAGPGRRSRPATRGSPRRRGGRRRAARRDRSRTCPRNGGRWRWSGRPWPEPTRARGPIPPGCGRPSRCRPWARTACRCPTPCRRCRGAPTARRRRSACRNSAAVIEPRLARLDGVDDVGVAALDQLGVLARAAAAARRSRRCARPASATAAAQLVVVAHQRRRGRARARR